MRPRVQARRRAADQEFEGAHAGGFGVGVFLTLGSKKQISPVWTGERA